MNNWTQLLAPHLLSPTWLPEVVLILAGAAVVNIVAHYLVRHAGKMARGTRTTWDDAIVQATSGPLPVLIWLVSIAFAAEIVHQHSGLPVLTFVAPGRDIGVVTCLAWFLIRLIHFAAENVVAHREAKGEEIDRTTVDALSKLGRLSVVIVAVLMGLHTLGFSVSGVLAFGGIGGLAIGFAAKDLLANFFGGLTIYLDRPFAVGEWVRSPDKDIEGTVEYISWRHTRIRRFNKNPLYVPNAVFTTIAVENPSRMSNRRIKETIGIRYADIGKVAAITTEVKTLLGNHPEIDTEQTLIVNFNTFGPSSLDFFIYAFTRTKEWARYHEIKQDILLAVAGIIARHGAEIAFPTQTVHLETAPPINAAP